MSLNVKYKIIKPTEDKIRINLCDFGFDDGMSWV